MMFESEVKRIVEAGEGLNAVAFDREQEGVNTLIDSCETHWADKPMVCRENMA